MSEEVLVLVERRGAVSVITLNRPDKLNALNRELVRQLAQALSALESDDSVGAIVLTGAGRAFSAGGDMREQVEDLVSEAPTSPRPSASAAVHACTKPVLAAVHGYCFGGGAILAIACDIRVGGDDVRFKFHGASYGLAPGGAMLPRIVGEAKAKELLFTCDEVLANEALRIGLLNQVVASTEVLEVTLAMAERIGANALRAVRALKETINLALPVGDALAHEEAVNRQLRGSSDQAARFRAAADRLVGNHE